MISLDGKLMMAMHHSESKSGCTPRRGDILALGRIGGRKAEKKDDP
jgi:hypothetical protein